jgi:imidazolonepropionase
VSDDRSALIGHGRLLTMVGPGAEDTGLVRGPWVLNRARGTITEVRSGRLRPGDPDAITDLGAALVTPGLVDPHTHLVFAGDRSDEAAARSRGEGYSGGGILRTVAATSAASDEALVAAARSRLERAIAGGTTTIEVKSGYGLDADAELRLLRLIPRAAAGLPIRILRTYLGAHAVPEGLTPRQQAEAVVAALPAVAGEADFIDVFCEPGLFDLDLSRRILLAGRAAGLGLRLHADQLTRSGGSLLGVELAALSVDHLEQAGDQEVRALAGSSTVATVLPGPALLLRAGLPPVRALLDAGAVLAIGSDANAGTYGSPSMSLAVGLAVALGCSVDEALRAATAGAARSLGLAGRVGSLRPGAAADLVAWDAEHEGDFVLRVGAVTPLRTWFAGEPPD